MIHFTQLITLWHLLYDFSLIFVLIAFNNVCCYCYIGRVSGVMDDRGKYIYISEEEMKAVADYIKREGRVSISHLASKSNQFIDLEPKSQFEEMGSTEQGISVA